MGELAKSALLDLCVCALDRWWGGGDSSHLFLSLDRLRGGVIRGSRGVDQRSPFFEGLIQNNSIFCCFF